MRPELMTTGIFLLTGAVVLLRIVEVDIDCFRRAAPPSSRVGLRRWGWAMRGVCALVTGAGLFLIAVGLGVAS